MDLNSLTCIAHALTTAPAEVQVFEQPIVVRHLRRIARIARPGQTTAYSDVAPMLCYGWTVQDVGVLGTDASYAGIGFAYLSQAV